MTSVPLNQVDIAHSYRCVSPIFYIHVSWLLTDVQILFSPVLSSCWPVLLLFVKLFCISVFTFVCENVLVFVIVAYNVRWKWERFLIKLCAIHVAVMLICRNFQRRYTTPWSESASELYRPSDRRLLAKWLPTFCGLRVPRGQRDGFLRPYSGFSRQEPLLFYQVAPQLYSRSWVNPVPQRRYR
jgi:hypothetical protein